jgi:hypothetical protein
MGGERQSPQTITDLDSIYFNRSSADFLGACRTFPLIFNLAQKQLEKQVIEELKSGSAVVHEELYKAYSGNLQKAVGGVLNGDGYESKYFDLQRKMQANVDRFAAYKAYHATRRIQEQRTDENGTLRSDKAYGKRAKAVFDAFNRYQVAEYNTAIARSRTARQWTDFNADPAGNELYPNLKWLPSRSALRREAHEKFYGMVFPKNHPFWRENQPGNLWQCKCDWEQTDEPASSGEVPTGKSAKGLEGNPGETGEIFTEEATYFNVSSEQKKEIERFLAEINKPAPRMDKTIIRAAYPDITGKVVETENKIRMNKQFETAVVFDSNGNIVVDKRGAATSVRFSEKELSMMKDCVFTHNHPRGWSAKEGTIGRVGNSFSIEDITVAVANDVAEIRAVTPTYTFSMKRPGNGWGVGIAELRGDFDKADMDMRRKMNSLINKTTTRKEWDQAVDRAQSLHFHIIWKELSRKYGFEYVKTKSVR